MPHHKPHHPHGPHRPHHGPGASLVVLIHELCAQRVPDQFLHDVIDSEIQAMVPPAHRAMIDRADPGRGPLDEPVAPLTRAAIVEAELRRFADSILARLANHRILVPGEFRPHVLAEILSASRQTILQVHPPGHHHHHGALPPHAHHLKKLGLIVVTDFSAALSFEPTLILYEAFRDAAGRQFTSPYVPISIAMFQKASTVFLDADHRAPHMTERIENDNAIALPDIFD